MLWHSNAGPKPLPPPEQRCHALTDTNPPAADSSGIPLMRNQPMTTSTRHHAAGPGPRALLLLAVAMLGMAACTPELPYYYDRVESPAIRTTPIRGGLISAQLDPGKGPVTAAPQRSLLGAVIPGQPGRSLSRSDQVFAQEAGFRAHAAALGQTVQWANPQTGNSGTITPIRQGLSTIGSVCRQYHQIVNIGGQIEEAYGTACMQPNGDWVVVN